MNVALICHNLQLASGVLRCLNANGVMPWLVCNRECYEVLRKSRKASGASLAGELEVSRDVAVELIAQRHRVDPLVQVMASDTAGLRLLDDIGSRIKLNVYPMPARAVLDVLDNKASFQALASHLGLPTPPSVFFASQQAIDLGAVRKLVGFPAVVKPLSGWSGIGFHVAHDEDDMRSLRDAAGGLAESVVVQKFIPGVDAGLSLFARNGKPLAMATFLCGPRCATEFVDIPAFAAAANAIVRETKFEGVANFDARLDNTGKLWLLECNPRFFMRLSATRLCGLDFLRLGLPNVRSVPGTAEGAFYSPATLASREGLARLFRGEWAVATLVKECAELLADPFLFVARHTQRIKWPSVTKVSDILHSARERNSVKSRVAAIGRLFSGKNALEHRPPTRERTTAGPSHPEAGIKAASATSYVGRADYL